MKKVIITKAGQVELREEPTPTPAKNFALVRITASPLCTEWHTYKAGHACQSFGHEAAGVVEAVGSSVNHISVGDRVVVMPQDACGECPLCLAGEHIHCQNHINPAEICGCSDGRATYATHCLQQDWLLVPVPDDVSDDHASMACCGLGPTFNAMQQLNVRSYDTVLVGGLGPVGLGAVINATHLGARVIGLDPSPYRAALARELGADVVLDPLKANILEEILEVSGGGADKAVETSNVPSSPPLLAEALKRKGQLALVSWSGEVSVKTIVGKGLSIFGAWHWNHQRYTPQMFDVIRNNSAKLDKVITHTMPLEKVEEAWKIQMTGQCGKIILHP